MAHPFAVEMGQIIGNQAKKIPGFQTRDFDQPKRSAINRRRSKS
jgi:hypothetical protein